MLADASGQTVQILCLNKQYSEGEHAETFRVHSLAPGTYYCVFQSGSRRFAQTLVVMPD